jgi:hypothetical protein
MITKYHPSDYCEHTIRVRLQIDDYKKDITFVRKGNIKGYYLLEHPNISLFRKYNGKFTLKNDAGDKLDVEFKNDYELGNTIVKVEIIDYKELTFND